MTMNFNIATFDAKPFVIFTLGETIKVYLDWVTHGNFSIRTERNDYLTLERHHFKEILQAFAEAPKPSERKLFWTGTIPARGFASDYLVEAYAPNENFIKFINSSCSFPHVPHYHCQMFLDVETLKKIAEKVDEYMGMRGEHE